MSTITASDATQLYQALKVAQPGDTIALEAGSYVGLRLFSLNFANDVTITSKDPGNPAVLTDLQVKYSSGLTFSNLDFFVDAAKGGWGLQVNDSKDIHFDRIAVHGSLDNNPQNDLSGMSIRNSSDVSVTNSEFQELLIGINHLNSDHITFSGNSIHDIQMDGIRGGGSSFVTISNNHFTDFYPIATDHPDAIQFWTTATTASAHDIVITNNLIERGDGKAMQGIFMGDESGGNLPYVDTVISGNMVVGSLWHGITAGSNVRVLVENNIVLGYSDIGARITLADSQDVTLLNNQATAYLRQRIVEIALESGNIVIPTTTTAGLTEINQWLAAHPDNAKVVDVGLPDTGDSSSIEPAPTPVPEPTPAPEPAPTPAPPPPTNQVVGTSGDDTLAGTSTSTLVGKAGNDVYNITSSTTAVLENAGEGLDTVKSTVSFTLSANVENLQLLGKDNINATGNDLANYITGNSGSNVLSGGGGNDTLVGGGGNDTLVGGDGNDLYVTGNNPTIIETATGGIDTITTIYGSIMPQYVENVVLQGAGGASVYGNSMNNSIIANAGANHLRGGAGNDTIDGRQGNDGIYGDAGNDVITGGKGLDWFHFERGSGQDVITDFTAGDTIDFRDYARIGANATLVDVGADTIVKFSTGDSIRLVGVDAHELQQVGTTFVFT